MPNQKGILPRLEVQTTPLDRHGALDFEELARLGIAPDEIIDFSVNSNPFGPSPAVRKALQNVVIERYPDRESLVLRMALAEKFNLDFHKSWSVTARQNCSGWLRWHLSVQMIQY